LVIKKFEGSDADMPDGEWVRSYPAAITVCNREGIIIETNDMAVKFLRNSGGKT
jgi:hypothetical protein